MGRNEKIVLHLSLIVIGMVGLSYAAVPLYRVFCQVTGFGGTTPAASIAPGTILDRRVKVQFDANTAPELPWEFRPSQRSQELHIGEVQVAHYRVKNDSSETVTGSATFNVTPMDAGQYFNKLECFCFSLQTLAPGEEMDMPVTYFIDPEIANEHRLDSVKTITLSYTFFRRDDVAVDN